MTTTEIQETLIVHVHADAPKAELPSTTLTDLDKLEYNKEEDEDYRDVESQSDESDEESEQSCDKHDEDVDDVDDEEVKDLLRDGEYTTETTAGFKFQKILRGGKEVKCESENVADISLKMKELLASSMTSSTEAR